MSDPLKILLIDAVDYRFEVEKRYQPLGIFYIIAQVKQRFAGIPIEFKLVNMNVRNELKQFAPHISAISCVSQNYNLAKTYAGFAKNSGSAVIIGGVHISAVPESLTKDMDAGVLGEGETTFGDLVELWLKQGCLPEEQLEQIPGLAYWHNGQVRFSPPRNFIPDLDSIAHPDRKMMNRVTQLNILTSRGCPFRCVFCFSTRNWGKMRFFSPEYICEEIQRILILDGKNKKNIGFWDDLFTARYSRLEKLYQLLDENNLLGRFQFYCSARSDTIKEDSVRLLKEMGCVGVGMGLESCNPDILRYLKGKGITVEHHANAIKCLKKYKIEVNASFIIGSPHETWEQVMDTYNFIRNHQIDIFDIYTLTPLPGTPVWDYAKEKGYVHDNMDWDLLNFRFGDAPQRAIVLSETLSREQLIQLFKKFRSLRWKRLTLTIWNSPHLWKVPGIIWGLLKEKVLRIISSRSAF